MLTALDGALIPSLPASTSVEKPSIECPLPMKRGDESGCYSPKVILTTRHGKICAYNEVF